MSAREELFRELVKGLQDSLYIHEDAEDTATKMIDDLLHEEAEKIREKWKSEAPMFPEEDQFVSGYGSGLDDGADLIDPYVKGE